VQQSLLEEQNRVFNFGEFKLKVGGNANCFSLLILVGLPFASVIENVATGLRRVVTGKVNKPPIDFTWKW
jgi:hypothetical protein